MLITGMKKVNKAVDAAYMTVSVLLLVLLVGASAAQVFTRYVLNNSLIGTEEVARYCFIWMSMLGGSICVGRWAHSTVSIVSDALPELGQKILFIFINVLIIICAYIFVTGGINMFIAAGDQLTPTMRIPKCLIYLCVPLGGAGMGLHSVEHILVSVKELADKKGASCIIQI